MECEGVVARQPRIGRFLLLRELGRGGQGVVHLAEDTRLRRRVALKVLSPGLLPDTEAVLRLRREAEVASRLEHPAICAVHDVGEHEGCPWIAMRYVEGETLAARIRRGHEELARDEASGVSYPTPRSGRARIDETLILVEKTARAVHAAHEAGVIHRDIKPGNIMIGQDGQPVILDFGLAREDRGEGPSLTRTGDVFGTPSYMSPEQLSTRWVRLDRRTDVWSLGVVLYESLTFRRPFEAPTREALYHAILARDPPDPRRFDRAIGSDLKVVLDTALEKDRDRRYQTALDLAEDVLAVREKRPIRARAVSRFGRILRWARREPAKASLATGMLAALSLIAGLLGYAISRAELARTGEAALLERRVEAAIDDGYLSLLQRERETAAAAFERALTEEPGNLLALAGLALTRLRLNWRDRLDDPEGALRVLDRSPPEALRDPGFLWVKVYVLRQAGRAAEADDLEQRLEDAKPAFREFLDGVILLPKGNRGDVQSAKRAFQSLHAAVLKSPRPRLVYHAVCAEAARDCGADAPTLRSIVQGLLLGWPEAPQAWIWASNALAYVDPEESFACIREAHRLDPRNPRALAGIGNCLGQRGNPEEAVRWQERALEVRPDYDWALARKGLFLDRLGRHEDAIACLRMASSRSPDDLHYRSWLVEALVGAGRSAEAEEVARAVVAQEPEYPWGWYMLGRALRARKDLEGARAACEQALRLKPESPAVLRELLEIIDLTEGREAVWTTIEQWIERHREGPLALNACAWFLVDPDPGLTHEPWEAALALPIAERAVEESHRKNAAVLDTLARALFLNGRAEEAARTQEEALRLLKPGDRRILDFQQRLEEFRGER